MKALQINQIVKAVKAIDYQSAHCFDWINHVTFDSRLCRPGSLFVPLIGGRTDGHDYVEEAIKNGASAYFWSRKVADAPEGACSIIVDDTLLAMQDLARYYRQLIHPLVVGITGSNGKTTTKDMIASVLGTSYKVHKTQGNYNNEIGLPQTILDMPEDTEVLVIEMGTSEAGEMHVLTEIAQPNFAVITLIGESHIEQLKTREGIAKEKASITDSMEEGTIIYPANEPLIPPFIPSRLKQLTFALEGASVEKASLWAENIQLKKHETRFTVDGEEFSLPVLGRHNVSNASAVILLGKCLNLSTEAIRKGLAGFDLTKNRNEWLKGVNGANLLNDAYNASPTSMTAILKGFQETEANDHKGRRMVVLGDMRELGEGAAQYHRDMAKVLDPELIDHVYLFGPLMDNLRQALVETWPENRISYIENDHSALIRLLKEDLQAGDDILFKASFGTGLLPVVESLRAIDE
ncbi:UDP-N-acetylmuramoyl-tripeptide--D-alanyl-D-alanine ligase [Atopobacter sp. AH10]|uniref:UDP-N-acetylmuramoyl-tripeptide--D-alanyl-D- alanine ligase n=1 Tax=Atopobacter sp. AH10 TaxID=2315861 RepID=UPI000EF2706E|nr:UDP-N-acetylmuramoyl-tripeptide--D-alanyl-D-alanine ligase [Atopobacter sp. AH10]RLK62893.1 UDP-N-acetylmuramoyl-tripeptide--D-alanyl-D-alanine ligase [Atopobacter sp. AH10]